MVEKRIKGVAEDLKDIGSRVTRNLEYPILIASAFGILALSNCTFLGEVGNFDITKTYKSEIVGQYSEDEPKRLKQNAQNDPTSYANYLLISMSTSKDPILRLLAERFVKLPDLNDGITYSEAKAMERIANLAKSDESAKSMLEKIAKKEAWLTSFSPSLQGLLWMAEEKEIDKETLKKYSPKELVNYSCGQLSKRLKTPEEILHFTTTNFSYKSTLYVKEAKETFVHKGGNCEATSGFEFEFLKKIGYNPKILVMFGTNTGAYMGAHTICYYDENEKFFSIDSSNNLLRISISRKSDNQRKFLENYIGIDFNKFNGIVGPFNTLTELLHYYNATEYKVFNSFKEYSIANPIRNYRILRFETVPPR